MAPVADKKDKKANLARISSDIDVALAYQDEDDWLEKYRRWKGYVYNRYPSSVDTPYVVNTYLSLLTKFVPNVYFNDPKVFVSTDMADVVVKDLKYPGYLVASIRQDLLNSIVRKCGLGAETKQSVIDCALAGFAVAKVGITSSTEPDRKTRRKGTQLFVTRISPEDVPFDPFGLRSFDNCAYVIHKYAVQLSHIKDKIDKEEYKQLEGFTLKDDTQKGNLYAGLMKKSMRKYVTLFEYHDQEQGLLQEVCRSNLKPATSTNKNEKPLEKDIILSSKKHTPPHNGSDFCLLRFLSPDDTIRGISVLGSQEDQALGINKVFSAQIRHIGMFGGIIVYEHGSITEEQADKWESSRQGDMLEVEPNTLLQGRIRRESPLQMGADYFNCISSFHQLIDRVLNIPDFQSLHATKRKSATESAFEQGDSSNYRNFFMQEVKNYVLDISKKLLAYAEKYLDYKDVVQLIGYDFDKRYWDDIPQGTVEWDLDFDVREMVPANQAEAMAMLQGISQLVQNPLTQQWAMSTLDPELVAKIGMRGVGVEIQYLYREDRHIRHEEDSENENQWFLEGRVVPSPNIFEPHDKHIRKHTEAMVTATEENRQDIVQRIRDHMALHMFYQQGLNPQPTQQAGMGMMAQGQGGNVPMNNPGTPGEMLTQPELIGNFRQ